MLSAALIALSAVPLALAQSNETVLGVYMFHRHGDRTAKSTPPANLTVLGFEEVYTSGDYFRNRYVSSNATSKIKGLNSDLVRNSQLAVSAPADTVLQNSATGFLQALYPPVGDLSTSTLANGTVVRSPGNGYQLIPVSLVTSGTGSEDNGWLQSSSGCAQATVSSNDYFTSAEYMNLLNSTQSFYNSIIPVVNGTFTNSQVSFKNAYVIYDLINVAEIHNKTISGSDVLTSDNLFQLRTLADSHEWGLAYNKSDDMRAVPGKVLAGQIVQALNTTVTSQGKTPLNIQFGAYGTFASFFGLAGLPSVNNTFYGIADYASVMVFELFTNATGSSFPGNDDIYVRFMFHNGTTSSISEPSVYPLFGSGQNTLKWNDFTNGMNKFAISNTQEWCQACGNTTGTCAAYTSNSSSSSDSSNGASTSSSSSGNGLSPAVNGVIGAMVTLAVILLIEGLIVLLGGFRLVRKNRLASPANGHGAVKA
ncbi:hypothetical protein AMS68_004522 [Peltaster fructicola]|uniref:3-phytase n=1 Tax=Peltaster fructicola TaxID=286661 RepID=A0A6H0XWH0_9PEZI|nr:hypothetical protein AMS68_004522 [Peltaster fructicola]